MSDAISLNPSLPTGEAMRAIDVANHIRSFTDYGSQNITIEKKNKIIALSLGRAISISLQLPTSPVTGLYAYYSDTCANRVEELICKINESYIIDCKLVADVTFKLFKLRYDLVYGADALSKQFAAITACCPDYISPALLDATAGCENENNVNSFSTLVRNVSYTLTKDADMLGSAVAVSN